MVIAHTFNIKLSIKKKTDNSVKKWTEDLNRYFTKDDK